MSDLGLALRILRLVRGRRLKQVAADAGVSMSVLSDYETGKKSPSLAALRRVVEAMAYSLATLAETESFLRHLRESASSESLPEDLDSAQQMREVHGALLQIGRGVTRLTLLAFRLLLRQAGGR